MTASTDSTLRGTDHIFLLETPIFLAQVHKWFQSHLPPQDILVNPVRRLLHAVDCLLMGWNAEHGVQFFKGELFRL